VNAEKNWDAMPGLHWFRTRALFACPALTWISGPSGDAALTRRAGKFSTLSAVVLKWSRARKRYERPGLLVEEPARQRAEQECLADAEVRARRRIRVKFHLPMKDEYSAWIRELIDRELAVSA